MVPGGIKEPKQSLFQFKLVRLELKHLNIADNPPVHERRTCAGKCFHPGYNFNESTVVCVHSRATGRRDIFLRSWWTVFTPPSGQKFFSAASISASCRSQQSQAGSACKGRLDWRLHFEHCSSTCSSLARTASSITIWKCRLCCARFRVPIPFPLACKKKTKVEMGGG